MERRKWFRRIGVALLSIAGVVSLAAFRGGPGGMHGAAGEGFFGARIEDMLDGVDATAQQREQVQAIADRLREKRRALRTERTGDREELVARWEAGTLDRAQLVAHMDARAEQMKAFRHEIADAMVEVQGILTPEQRARVAEKMRRRMDRMDLRGGPRRGAAD